MKDYQDNRPLIKEEEELPKVPQPTIPDKNLIMPLNE